MLVNFDGIKLCEIRKRRNISQVNLADQIDCSDHYIRDLEHGRKSHPSVQIVYKIAVVLDVPMETFMKIKLEDGDEFFMIEQKF